MEAGSHNSTTDRELQQVTEPLRTPITLSCSSLYTGVINDGPISFIRWAFLDAKSTSLSCKEQCIGDNKGGGVVKMSFVQFHRCKA